MEKIETGKERERARGTFKRIHREIVANIFDDVFIQPGKKQSMLSEEKSQESDDIKEKQKPHKLSSIIIDIQGAISFRAFFPFPFEISRNTSPRRFFVFPLSLSLWSTLDEHFEMISQRCFSSHLSVIFSTHCCDQIHLLSLSLCNVLLPLHWRVDIHMQDENVYLKFFCLFARESNEVWTGTQ